MKTIKEILTIGMKYHYCWDSDGDYFMCHAVRDAGEMGELTEDEVEYAKNWIELCVLENNGYVTLVGALGLDNDPSWRDSTKETVKNYWERVISKME